MIFSFFLLICI